MKRKLVQAGSSLAVTIPADVVRDFELEKGMEVEVNVHPRSGLVMVEPGVRYFDGGEVTPRFKRLVKETMKRRAAVYRRLAE